jgi:hypothetical protein
MNNEMNLTFIEMGRLFQLYILDTIPTNREELKEVLKFENSDSLKHFLAKLEKDNWITRSNKLNRNFVDIKLTDKFFSLIKQTAYYYLYRLYFNNEIVYIGKTNNLKERLSQHKKDKEFNFYDYYVGNKSDINLYEIYYIEKLKPIHNKDCKSKSKLNTQLKELEFIKGGN